MTQQKLLSGAIFVLATMLFTKSVDAASITPSYKSSCVLMSNRIYCFSGGYAALGDMSARRALSENHYLDLTQTLMIDETSSKWTSIPNDPDFVVEPTLASTSCSVSQDEYIIDGGYNGSPLINITRMFNIQTNKWSNISEDKRNITNTIYMGTAVKVPNQDRVVYWGGLTEQYPGLPVSEMSILNNVSTETITWSIGAGSLPLGTSTRFGHTATLDVDGASIFYLGGRVRTTNYNDNTDSSSFNAIPYSDVPMSNVLVYNTVQATWDLRNSPSAPSSMSPRYMHTATRSSSGMIVIYGGATDSGNERRPTAVSDYLYLFNPKTLEFTRLNEINAAQGAGPRFGHSALLSNRTLFILFGVNQIGLITNDVYFLSMSDSGSTWLTTLSLFSASTNPNGDGTAASADNNNSQNKLSNQAIIGITIGSVLLIIILIAALVYKLNSLRLKRETSQQELSNNNNSNSKAGAGDSFYFDDDNSSNLDNQDLPRLHKEYQTRYSSMTAEFDSPNEYSEVRDISSHQPPATPNSSGTSFPGFMEDSSNLDDVTTPPFGFSFDHIVIPAKVHKPNQVIDQPFFSAQRQGSSGSFYMLPTDLTSAGTNNQSDLVSLPSPHSSLIKPSVSNF